MTCPKCGSRVYHLYDTASGYEVQRDICFRCGWEQRQRGGKALWKVWTEQRPGLRQWLLNLFKR